MPFLAQAYSRSCEYTCDREAAYIINNAPAAKRALTILSVGKQVYREVNEDAFVEQISAESHGVVWVSEILSSHPNLPKRIQSVSVFMGETSRPIYTENAGKVVVGVLILGAATIGAYFAIIGSVAGGTVLYGSIITELEEEIGFGEYDDTFYEYETTELMDAVNAEDLDEVNRLIESGVNLNDQDGYGETALHYAVFYGNTEIVGILLEAGADPNHENERETTPLIAAVYYDYLDGALLLLDYGANPELEDLDGDSAMNLLNVETEEELREALTE
ncbi:ankyrin repeat domain-containing protein [Alkalicoccobacillus plakortidis]|uniref:Ankyrin repeat domain-containing protein n=1 Tax=Alkalicoccobacillus plakortidis TaxID=444060 RepID=A0ABT0XJY0_9BACI|nr:ankyrin repeat domain-containing protein [Alkalicoccobacillus plakortidis]MCM2676196.1 ankyrin repeat domain-containing protein [Alkalicoccobacillus plakortidis]